MLTVTKQGNQKHYQANADAPVFAELRGLVLKTMGLADVLRVALAPLAPQIDLAFVHGSVAKQRDTAQSDVDVTIMSAGLGHADVFGALEGAATTLGRKVSLTPSREQFNAFVTSASGIGYSPVSSSRSTSTTRFRCVRESSASGLSPISR